MNGLKKMKIRDRDEMINFNNSRVFLCLTQNQLSIKQNARIVDNEMH